MTIEQFEAPRPVVYCSLGNSYEIDCDSCRLKATITFKGIDFFCVSHVIESQFFDEMKECKRNISLSWGNNYLVEAKGIKDDPLDTVERLGVGVEGEVNQPMDTVGTHDEEGERGSKEPNLETEETVGEVFQG